jgi:hypothetical protein
MQQSVPMAKEKIISSVNFLCSIHSNILTPHISFLHSKINILLELICPVSLGRNRSYIKSVLHPIFGFYFFLGFNLGLINIWSISPSTSAIVNPKIILFNKLKNIKMNRIIKIHRRIDSINFLCFSKLYFSILLLLFYLFGSKKLYNNSISY